MIRHCVFINYRPDTPDDVKRDIEHGIRALEQRIEGFVRVDFGSNVSPEGLDKGHDEGFVIDFRDSQALDTYLNDEDHKAVGANIVATAEGGLDGVFVFDLAVD